MKSFLLALLTISTVIGAFLVANNMRTLGRQLETQIAAFDSIIKGVLQYADPVGGGGGGPGAIILAPLNLK